MIELNGTFEGSDVSVSPIDCIATIAIAVC